jgi:hypothetical protein
MRYPVFLGFDIVGGIAWGAGMPLLGYFLCKVPFVKKHLELMIRLIVFLSILPGIISVRRPSWTAADHALSRAVAVGKVTTSTAGLASTSRLPARETVPVSAEELHR